MAGVSTKEIKNRIRSMESTKQITKAMEMVAASKLRHAQARVTNSRPYFQILSDTICDIVDSNSDFSSPYLVQRPVKRYRFCFPKNCAPTAQLTAPTPTNSNIP